MRAIFVLLLLLPTASATAGKFDIAIALALFEARQDSIVSAPTEQTKEGGDPSTATTEPAKPKLWFYTGTGCEPCERFRQDLRADSELWALIDQFELVEEEIDRLPKFVIEGRGEKYQYESAEVLKQWLRRQLYSKPEMR